MAAILMSWIRFRFHVYELIWIAKQPAISMIKVTLRMSIGLLVRYLVVSFLGAGHIGKAY